MKKILFSAIVIATSLTAFSQVNGRIAKSGPSLNTPVIIDQPSINSSLAISCTTLTTLSSTSLSVGGASSDTTTPGCSPNAGYVYGNNCYGDKEKANFFAASSYSLYTGANVTSVIVGFFQSGTEGTGGVSTHTVGMTLYNGTNVTTAPGTAIGSTVATLGAIAAAHTGTTNVFYYTFNFAAPLTAPTTGGFYASLVLPTAAGDTAVVANQTSAPVNKAWEKWTRAVCVQFLFVSVPEVFYFFMPVLCPLLRFQFRLRVLLGVTFLCTVFFGSLLFYRAKGSSVWLTA